MPKLTIHIYDVGNNPGVHTLTTESATAAQFLVRNLKHPSAIYEGYRIVTAVELTDLVAKE